MKLISKHQHDQVQCQVLKHCRVKSVFDNAFGCAITKRFSAEKASIFWVFFNDLT